MDLDSLIAQIESAEWFESLGQYSSDGNSVALASLSPAHSPEGIEWLPTARDEIDPIHGDRLEGKAKEKGLEKEVRSASMEVYKITLKSLRTMRGNPLLKVGNSDSKEAAKGAALFAARRAAAEIVLGEEGFWCTLIPLFGAGHWPCGRLLDRRLVVF